jgi:hypothetical protein
MPACAPAMGPSKAAIVAMAIEKRGMSASSGDDNLRHRDAIRFIGIEKHGRARLIPQSRTRFAEKTPRKQDRF